MLTLIKTGHPEETRSLSLYLSLSLSLYLPLFLSLSISLFVSLSLSLSLRISPSCSHSFVFVFVMEPQSQEESEAKLIKAQRLAPFRPERWEWQECRWERNLHCLYCSLSSAESSHHRHTPQPSARPRPVNTLTLIHTHR